MKNVLLVGETWFLHTIHVKGFDQFTENSYGEGAGWLIDALNEGGYEVNHVANHKVVTDFPYTLEELQEYDVIILSDIGSNTLLLPETTFQDSKINPNRCELIKEYVRWGGSFLMIGGYMSFSGINGASRYEQTAIQDILPVNCLGKDDRVERPEGITPEIVKEHYVFEGVDKEWPHFLGYNKTTLKDGAILLATIGEDPFIAIDEFGKGKSAAFTSDCAPHWGPPEFVNWEYYNRFWINLMDWLSE